MSKEKPKKEYREHGKKYGPYKDDIILSHLQGMSDKELANILERKIDRIKEKRTEYIREFLLNNMSSLNYFVWMATKFYLQNKLLKERLDNVGITVLDIEISNDDIQKQMKDIQDIASNGNISEKYPEWNP
tara:strand:+ start:18562 stop:18954 length:393 start_codon:yes stop_codon:yes gene_type:complete